MLTFESREAAESWLSVNCVFLVECTCKYIGSSGRVYIAETRWTERNERRLWTVGVAK